MRRIWFCMGLLAWATSVAVPVMADDWADEADLKFRLGAEAYQRGDFRGRSGARRLQSCRDQLPTFALHQAIQRAANSARHIQGHWGLGQCALP